MYFASFPKIYYDSGGQGDLKLVTNLLKRVAIRSKVKSNTMLYDTYDVKNGESPESIADKLYDDPELQWVVLLFNDIISKSLTSSPKIIYCINIVITFKYMIYIKWIYFSNIT